MIELKSRREISQIRQAGRIVAGALNLVQEMVAPGVTTAELDTAVEDFVLGQGGTLAFKGYRGFPASICASINEEVVHGIPGDRKLLAGDIASVDVGVQYNNYFADAAATFPVDSISAEAERLIKTCRDALARAIEIAAPSRKLSDIARAIQKHVEDHNFSVVRQYVGHGIGKAMHEEPQIPNFVSKELLDNDVILKPGMVLAVEPMINAGSHEVKVLKSGWTVVTKDSKLSAHFEHTIGITSTGADVLTIS